MNKLETFFTVSRGQQIQVREIYIIKLPVFFFIYLMNSTPIWKVKMVAITHPFQTSSDLGLELKLHILCHGTTAALGLYFAQQPVLTLE